MKNHLLIRLSSLLFQKLAIAKILIGVMIMKKLNEVECQTTVKVTKLTATGLLRERLLALGITTGALIDVIKKGPKNNLTVYNIRGAMIALREEEGSLIMVKPIHE